MGLLKNKYPSFTLLELLIVLVLFTLVAGIASLAYTLLLKQYAQFRTESETHYSLELLYHLLYTDIHSCEAAHYTAEGWVFSTADQQTAYVIQPDYLLRKSPVQTDTFFVQAEVLNCYMQGRDAIPEGLFDELHLLVQAENSEKCPLSCKVTYGADVLMKWENNNNGYAH